jgi:hypothetical protein
LCDIERFGVSGLGATGYRPYLAVILSVNVARLTANVGFGVESTALSSIVGNDRSRRRFRTFGERRSNHEVRPRAVTRCRRRRRRLPATLLVLVAVWRRTSR